jgi:phosphate starvation-inducible PhoH-like protein
VITGDVTQIDLPSSRISGLVQVMDVLGHVDGVSFVSFTDMDVVRHPIVQAIVRAYDSHEST